MANYTFTDDQSVATSYTDLDTEGVRGTGTCTVALTNPATTITLPISPRSVAGTVLAVSGGTLVAKTGSVTGGLSTSADFAADTQPTFASAPIGILASLTQSNISPGSAKVFGGSNWSTAGAFSVQRFVNTGTTCTFQIQRDDGGFIKGHVFSVTQNGANLTVTRTGTYYASGALGLDLTTGTAQTGIGIYACTGFAIAGNTVVGAGAAVFNISGFGTLDLTKLTVSQQADIASRTTVTGSGKVVRILLPSDLGAVGWYRKQFFTDYTLNANGKLSSWKDLITANARNLLQATDANMPTVDSATGWFRFDNSLNMSPATPFSSNDFTVVGVFRSPRAAYVVLTGGNPSLRIQQYNGTNALGMTVPGNDASSGVTIPSANVAFVATWRKAAANANATARLNGAADATIPTSNAAAVMSFSSLGNGTVGGAYFLTSELIVAPTLTTADVARLEGYIAWANGQQTALSAAHPYASAPPIGIQTSSGFTPTN